MSDSIVHIFNSVSRTGRCFWDFIDVEFLPILLNLWQTLILLLNSWWLKLIFLVNDLRFLGTRLSIYTHPWRFLFRLLLHWQRNSFRFHSWVPIYSKFRFRYLNLYRWLLFLNFLIFKFFLDGLQFCPCILSHDRNNLLFLGNFLFLFIICEVALW